MDGEASAHSRHTVRCVLEATDPEMRIIAEGFLAERSPIDLLGVGGEGELVAVRIASPGADSEALTHLLADLSWLRSRRRDFLKLLAGLGIDPTLEPRGVLVAREFGSATRGAVEHFPPRTVTLWKLASESDAERLAPDFRNPPPPPAPDLAPEPRPPLTAPPSPSAFRTGLQESDLP